MDNSTNQIRIRYRELRENLSADAQAKAGQLLSDYIRVLPEYQQAKRIATYFAVNGEISLKPLIDYALKQGKLVYLPNLDQNSLRFSPYYHQQKMRTNRYKLPEPDVPDEEMITPESLDLVLAPLVVFDAQGNRIGMGGGFYDRSFAFRKHADQLRPVLIGVAHEIQRIDRLEPQPWDIQLDMVVTDQAIYR